MAGFLRRKSKQEPLAATRPVTVPALNSISSSTSPAATPLFARFATSSQQPEVQKTIVSGPMILSSNARRDVHPVGQHRRVGNEMPVNGQVRRDTIEYKQAKELPPLQSRPSLAQPQPQVQPRARPVAINKALPLPAEPVPTPKPIPPASSLSLPSAQARTPSPAIDHGEYAHLWSVISGDDTTVLQGSPPSLSAPIQNTRTPPSNSTQSPLQLNNSIPQNSTSNGSQSSAQAANGFSNLHVNGQRPNTGRPTLENFNDPSGHDTSYEKRINPNQLNSNTANMRANPVEDVSLQQQSTPPTPLKPNGTIPKSRTTSSYFPQRTPEPISKQGPNYTSLPSPSSSPDSNRRLTRPQETPAFNGEQILSAPGDNSLPSSFHPDGSRLTAPSQRMGTSTSSLALSLGPHSLRSSMYRGIHTEDMSSPPPERNITQQPSPPISPTPPRKNASMRQSLIPTTPASKGKPLIFAAMASVDPEPENQAPPPPPSHQAPAAASDRPPLMSAPQVEQIKAWNNVPPPQPHGHFQNHNQFQQHALSPPPPPQSYRSPPPPSSEAPFPARQDSLSQRGRAPLQPQQQQLPPPPPGQHQQSGPVARSNGSIRWNDRVPPLQSSGPPPPHPIHFPQPHNISRLPPQSFGQPQPQQAIPPHPPHGPRPSNSPPRDLPAQLRMSPDLLQRQPPASQPASTKGRRLSKKLQPLASDAGSIRSQKWPGSGHANDRPQPQPQPQPLYPQQQIQNQMYPQQRQPQHPLQQHHQNQTYPQRGQPQHPPQHQPHNHLAKPQPPPPMGSATATSPPAQAPPAKFAVDRDPLGVPLSDDPFARTDGVKMLSPFSKESRGDFLRGEFEGEEFHSLSGSPSPRISQNLGPSAPDGPSGSGASYLGDGEVAGEGEALTSMEDIPNDGKDRLTDFLSEPTLLGNLLSFFSFYDWCIILSLSREVRYRVVQNPQLREAVLERYLRTVGYTRWMSNDSEPLSLSLQDLNDYMRGVSTPTHEYARVSALYIHSLGVHPSHRDQSLDETVANLSAATRAYTRVVLRLRAQAEKEASVARKNNHRNSGSRPGSRAPSPTMSTLSHSNHGHREQAPPQQRPAIVSTGGFQSPLFRLRRAPLLRVFVPSPDGDWLSDKSVLECEAELGKAGVSHLMRMGDVVWDVAVGDEGNVGRLVWDGTYLIDLDYTYASAGDLPKYLPTLAFPPSYFHRVIRSGLGSSNPIAHIDIRPWGEEIAVNLQLLQDRVRTETPQGAYHNVVRWVHRSSFQIRPILRGGRGPNPYNHRGSPYQGTTRIPIPGTSMFVDPGWYGTIVLETEGTNESLADLQERCGPGAFPPRPQNHHGRLPAEQDRKMVYRIMREKSRPGEIWMRAVSAKERLL